RMDAHASYAVFTRRDDDPPAGLLRDAGVPALDPAVWHLATRDLAAGDLAAGDTAAGHAAAGDPLLEVLRELAFEREPPIPKRSYPTPHLYRQAVTVEVGRADSLYPDAIGFAT